MAAVVTWPRRLRVSPAISLSSFSSFCLLLTTYSISIRLPYNHEKDKKSFTLQNTKTRYTLDTSTKQWSGQGLIIRTQSTAIFLCIQPFSAWWRTNNRTTRWSQSKPALDQCETAVFCNCNPFHIAKMYSKQHISLWKYLLGIFCVEYLKLSQKFNSTPFLP